MMLHAQRNEAFEWKAESRFAIYYAPRRDSMWWDEGCRWLARDPESGEVRDPPVLPALARRSSDIPRLSRAAWRYGWHGTLVAPARRAPGIAPQDIVEHARAWARRQQPFELCVEAATLERFVAIRPATADGAAAMQSLAASALHAFAAMRALPNEHERRRRLEAKLTARQRELLDGWGYPYVLDEFRFHMTLSDSIDEEDRQILIDWWSKQVSQLGPLPIDSAALFVEPGPGEPFALVARFPFGGEQ